MNIVQFSHCSYCGSGLSSTDQRCPYCGAPTIANKPVHKSRPFRFNSFRDVWEYYNSLPLLGYLENNVTLVNMLRDVLILSDSDWGDRTGKIIRFSQFGETKTVSVESLISMVEKHPSFSENLYYFILSKDFVERYGISEFYSLENQMVLSRLNGEQQVE